MPTMTAIALERLLEPNADRSAPQKPKPPIPHRTTTTTFAASDPTPLPPPRPYFISPALYATPDPAALPDSTPTSISPSPYVVNRKGRRGPRPLATAAPTNRLDGFEIPDVPLAGMTTEVGGLADEEAGLTANCSVEKQQENGDKNQQHEEEEAEEEEDDDGKDNFLDPQDSRSVASSCSARFGNQSRLWNQSEFYDAAEEFFSDGSASYSSPSLGTNPEIELPALRLNLLEEIHRRKIAEEALLHMQNEWNRTAKYLSQVGVSFPVIQHAEDVQVEINSAAICQEITVSRFVSEAIERGLVRAEAEAAAEEVIHSKNHEISRLRDRLQYYEAVNREMSQRNQEIVELARQQRLRRKRWRWLWSCIGLSITIGASLLAYSYVPHSGKDSLTTSCPDAPPGTGGSMENES
uniref:Uncharacterized protein LOC105040143 n=1 Tax=Elaeis guineensis var. tenera TaxID=51953 RepID=A0A6I9QXK7_ELAGV|nr:uncharacterized protein LOC105040143 [Elaeis guineensis]